MQVQVAHLKRGKDERRSETGMRGRPFPLHALSFLLSSLFRQIRYNCKKSSRSRPVIARRVIEAAARRETLISVPELSVPKRGTVRSFLQSTPPESSVGRDRRPGSQNIRIQNEVN